MEEEGCKQQGGLLHALFINIQMTKILANFRKTFHILWKHSATLSWRGKDGTVPSRDAAGWGEATLGSESHDLGLGTAFATLKLYGLREDKFSGLHIHMPLYPARLSFFYSGNGILWLVLPTSQEKLTGCIVRGNSFQPADVPGGMELSVSSSHSQRN